VKTAIVGGLESYIDVETLSWLSKTVRLKTDDVPSGFQPGEACAFILLETPQAAKARKAQVYGLIEGITLSQDSKTLLSGKPSLGQGMAEAVQKLSSVARWGKNKAFWVLCDQSGERYRAMEWGNAAVRLSERSKAFSEPIVWYPAASFGDTGAASAAVALCLATSAFKWGYAPSRTAAVISSSDGPQRAAILVSDIKAQ
jgi:3-oxoacyl-[acyl-carrier-protein] synthase-1